MGPPQQRGDLVRDNSRGRVSRPGLIRSASSTRDATRAEGVGASPQLLARAVVAEFDGGADEIDRVAPRDAGGQKGCCAGPSRPVPPPAPPVGRAIRPGVL